MLPEGDRTPDGFELPQIGFVECLKRPARRLVYPTYNYFNNLWLSRRYDCERFMPDLWLWGQRGNDYENQRRRVNSLLPLNGKDILIVGCGTGRDIPSWLTFKPASLTGVDYFNYRRAWAMSIRQAVTDFPSTRVVFKQADIIRLDKFPDASVDIIGSDAVFEHLKNLPRVLEEFARILKPGGIVYATFGPLWYSWGGDHVSGYDGIENGYNHLILKGEEYRHYVSGVGQYNHSEHDGRTWLEHDLFNRLRAGEYLTALSYAGFGRLFVSAIIEPRGVLCLKQNRQVREKLLSSFEERDLLITGMTIIYRK